MGDRAQVLRVVGFAVSTALMSTTGCMMQADGAGEGATEDVGSASEALMTAEQTWSQGQAPVVLGSSSNRFCYLTSISGKFEGGGESVHVRINNGQWELTGTSGQVGVSARARCQLNVSGANITGEFSWVQGQSELNLGSTNTQACFLTRVAGKFNGGGEAVWVRKSGSTYLLGGMSNQVGVGTRARCLTGTSTFINDWTWSQGSVATVMVQALTENNGWACGLTRMTGSFKGGGERIFIDWDGSTRRLRGSSSQSGVAASANCF
jgi:hypothetical protein